jgi:hypothetical protein
LLTTLSDTEIAARFTGPQHFPRRTDHSVQTLDGRSGRFGWQGSTAMPSTQRGSPRRLLRSGCPTSLSEPRPLVGYRCLSDGRSG